MMGDLLKKMRSSQIFSVCGLPEVKVHSKEPAKKDDPSKYQVELVGDYNESVWDHLAGTTSAPFEAGEHRQVAVKVMDE